MLFDYMSVGRKIKELRSKNRLSQAELAELVDVSTPYISNVENGRKFLKIETLVAICNSLGVTPDILLADALDNHKSPAEREFAEVLEDCTLYESRIIIGVATAVKKTLRDNGYLTHKQ